MSSPVAARAQALHRLLELTECQCPPEWLHATHCLAEYRQDVEALVGNVATKAAESAAEPREGASAGPLSNLAPPEA